MAQQKCISPEVGELYIAHMQGLLQGQDMVPNVREKLSLIAHGARCRACREKFNEMMSQQAHHLARVEADSPEKPQCTEPDIGNQLRTVLDGEGTVTDELRTRLPEHCAQCAACTHILRHWLPGDECSDPPTGAKLVRRILGVEDVPDVDERVRVLLHGSQCEGCRSRLLRNWLSDQLREHFEPKE